MRFLRVLLTLLGLLLLLVVGAAIAVPYFFKDELITKVKQVANDQLNAQIDFEDVDLNLLRSFPNLQLSIKALEVNGIEDFEGVPLVELEALNLTVDIGSVLRSGTPILIRKVKLDRPMVHLLVLPDGRPNYLIAKTKGSNPANISESPSSNDFRLLLNRYTIKNGDLIYNDRQQGLFVRAGGMAHSGSGDFTASQYDLKTETTIDTLTLSYGGFNYLHEVETALDAVFRIDQREQRYELVENDLRVNALYTTLDGFIQQVQNDYTMDLTVKAPGNEFKELWSLIPGAYTQAYEEVEVGGSFALQGKVKGVYSADKELYPAIQANVNVSNGVVQYPGLPLGISDVETQLEFTSPGDDFDKITVAIPRFSLRIGDNPLEGRFMLKTPMSDPDINGRVKGVLDLGALSEAFPFEQVQELNGRIVADVTARARQSQIEGGRYEEVDMEGSLALSEVRLQSNPYPSVRVEQARMEFSPQFVDLPQFKAQLGRSSVSGEARVDNILAYFSPEKTMKGRLKIRTEAFDANEWMQASTSNSPSTPQTTPAGREPEEAFDRFDFRLDALAETVIYGDYQLRDLQLVGRANAEQLEVEEASLKIDQSDLKLTGSLAHWYDYALRGGELGGNLNIVSNRLDLNPFMQSVESPATQRPKAVASSGENASMGVILIPENVNLFLGARVGTLLYNKLIIRNLSGTLQVAEQAVALEEVRGNALGGNIQLSGAYDTKDPENPTYALAYQMESVQFQQAFDNLISVQKLAPIARSIDGAFSTSLDVNGTLTDQMQPDLSTLNAKGVFETLEAMLKSTKPTQLIANTLDVEELKSNIDLSGLSGQLEIANGQVEIAPFDLRVGDLFATISGSHGLDRQMDYDIELEIPRDKLGSVGAVANNLLGELQGQASRLGINFNTGDMIELGLNLTGSLQAPEVKIDLLGTGDGNNVSDAAKTAVKEQLEEEKAKLEASINKRLEEGKKRADELGEQAIDSAKVVVDAQVERLKAEARKKAAEVLGKDAAAGLDSLLQGKSQEEISKLLDSLKVGGELENLKKELEKWNPFKRKEKGG